MPYIIYTAVKYLIDLLELAIFVSVIVSWLPVRKDSRFMLFIYQITEPLMSPVRKMLQKSSFTKNMMIDFSPVVTILLLEFLKGIMNSLLIRI